MGTPADEGQPRHGAKGLPGAKYISASEVNRFSYCPWQWYYERVYGPAELREMKRAYNEEMGFNASHEDTVTAFEKGRKFHEGYAGRYARRAIIRRLGLTAVFCAFVAVVLWIYLGL